MRHILNSAVIPAGAYGAYAYAAATPEDLRVFCAGPNRPRSSIGYAETAALIERLTGWLPPLSREPTELAPGDVAMVVRLRYRVADPARKGAATGTDLDAWEIGRLERLSVR